jgi:hypothetical protein
MADIRPPNHPLTFPLKGCESDTHTQTEREREHWLRPHGFNELRIISECSGDCLVWHNKRVQAEEHEYGT